MLADSTVTATAGQLILEIAWEATQPLNLLNFIASQLPIWRDHPHRPWAEAETDLTDQLCSHLNMAARFSDTWSRVQFRTEVRDEVNRGRSIDLTPKPCGAVIFVEGRRHTQFDLLLPIECKRLPTPRGSEREEREYVNTSKGTSGGIQRFKFALHGAAHSLAAIIGYVQEHTFQHWHTAINGWIDKLSSDPKSGWRKEDYLLPLVEDLSNGVASSTSRHSRTRLDDIELRHLWVKME